MVRSASAGSAERRQPPETPAFPIDRANLIAGLGRGLTVIESFDYENPRMTCSEVSQRTGLPPTATRRHLLSLCHFGYAETNGKQFWLAPRVLRLGQSYLDSARLPRLVQPFIQRLSMATGESVNLSVLDGHEVVYVARSNSPRVVSIGFHVGARVPAHVVGPGVVLLAALKDAALDAWIEAHEFSAFSSHTVVDKAEFHHEVLAARRQDYWISEGRLDPGLIGVATVLKDRFGVCKGAIGLTLQSPVWNPESILAKLVPGILDTVNTLRPLI